MKKKVASGVSLGLSLVLMSTVTVLTGCRFGFASDPDDPNQEVVEEPIDTSIDTFQYDSSLGGDKNYALEFQGGDSGCTGEDGSRV